MTSTSPPPLGKRILLAMIEPPLPLGSSAPARWLYVLLKGLVERGHCVTAFTVFPRVEEIPKCKALFPAPQYDLRCYPLGTRAGLSGKLRTALRPYSYMFSDRFLEDWKAETAKGFDVLHLEQLWSGWLGLSYPERSLVNLHHLTEIDLGELAQNDFRQMITTKLMFRTEHRLLKKYPNIRSCSPRLVPYIKKINPRANVTVVPVGMDPALYDFISDEKRTTEPVVSVIGTMNWYPTSSAAVRLLTRLWPKIKQQVPNARCQIVGWEARSVLKDYLSMPDVTIEQNVPEIRPYFERTGVMLYAPGRGSGMKIKILEAMGFGIPVVTTSEGVEGIPAVDGVHASICEDDNGLIERAVALLKDVVMQNRQRRAARVLFESHCGPKPTVDAIVSIYDRMLSSSPSQRQTNA